MLDYRIPDYRPRLRYDRIALVIFGAVLFLIGVSDALGGVL